MSEKKEFSKYFHILDEQHNFNSHEDRFMRIPNNNIAQEICKYFNEKFIKLNPYHMHYINNAFQLPIRHKLKTKFHKYAIKNYLWPISIPYRCMHSININTLPRTVRFYLIYRAFQLPEIATQSLLRLSK